MKIEQVICFSLAVFVMFRFLIRRMALLPTLLIMGAFVTNPFIWEFKDNVVSEIPFFLLAAGSLSAMDLNEQTEWKRSRLAISAAILVYCAFATRSLGVALIPALLPSVLRHRRAPIRLILAIALTVVLIGFHSAIFRTHGSYFDQLRAPVPTFMSNARLYLFHFGRALIGLRYSPLEVAFTSVLLLLSLAGFVRQCMHRLGCAEVFLGAYVFLILLWPGDSNPRFFIPILVLVLLYVAETLLNIPARLARVIAAFLVLITIAGYVHRYRELTVAE